MKKLLLLSISAMMSLGAMAQITVADGYGLKEDWTHNVEPNCKM